MARELIGASIELRVRQHLVLEDDGLGAGAPRDLRFDQGMQANLLRVGHVRAIERSEACELVLREHRYRRHELGRIREQRIEDADVVPDRALCLALVERGAIQIEVEPEVARAGQIRDLKGQEVVGVSVVKPLGLYGQARELGERGVLVVEVDVEGLVVDGIAYGVRLMEGRLQRLGLDLLGERRERVVVANGDLHRTCVHEQPERVLERVAAVRERAAHADQAVAADAIEVRPERRREHDPR